MVELRYDSAEEVLHRLRRRPDPLKAVKVRGGDVAPFESVVAEHGGTSRRDAVSVLVDEELVVRAVDRVVQDDLVQPDLDALDFCEWPVQRKSVADLRGHGVADALFPSALCHSSAVRSAEGDPNSHAAACLASNDVQQTGVPGEEQCAVRKNADLAFG